MPAKREDHALRHSHYKHYKLIHGNMYQEEKVDSIKCLALWITTLTPKNFRHFLGTGLPVKATYNKLRALNFLVIHPELFGQLSTCCSYKEIYISPFASCFLIHLYFFLNSASAMAKLIRPTLTVSNFRLCN